MQTFAEFLATRTAHANICAAAKLTPEEMSIDSERPGWLYSAEEPYYLIQMDAETVGAVVTIDTITQPTLEAAEASLYALTHDSREVDQFETIRHHFPHYDDILPIVPGFTESSWYKDTRPKMVLNIGDYRAMLWCDYRSTNYRELDEENAPQFSLTIGTDEDFELIENIDHETIPNELAHHVLTKIMQHWCETQGLLHESADEMILRDDLTAEQRQFISDVINAWEVAE